MPYKPPIKTVDVQVTVQMVECDNCGRQHDPDGDTYLSVHGNICIGSGGGVVGNNLDKETGQVNRISIFCLRRKCILDGMFYPPAFDFMFEDGGSMPDDPDE